MEEDTTIANTSLKINKNNSKNYYFSKNLVNDSSVQGRFDNTFCIIKSIDNILILIYTNENNSIKSYNLIHFQLMIEIKKAHDQYITNLRYILDNINKRDLIISVSKLDNNIKLWNIKNWNCLLNMKNINNKGYLYSACFLEDNQHIYILTSNGGYDKNAEPIKLYDYNNGKKVKDINESTIRTYFIDTFYDKTLSINYIITGNDEYVKSYDFNTNKKYHLYYDSNYRWSKCHYSIVIYYNDKNINMIESNIDYIRIWDFHSEKLLNKIKVGSCYLYGICLWNNKQLFVGTSDHKIKLIDIEKQINLKTLSGHKNKVLTLRKINHPQYGECLISQSAYSDSIKLWKI